MEMYTKEDLAYLTQGSEAWTQERIGKINASNFVKCIADVKRPMTDDELANRPPKSTAKTIEDVTLLSTGALTYIDEIMGERITGESSDSGIDNDATRHGKLYEPVARRLYERVKGVKVTEVGRIDYKPLKGFVGGSPDGIIGEIEKPNGGIEIKCPVKNAIHFANLKLDNVWMLKAERPDHFWQCIGGMLLTGAKYWDFVSYSPNFPMRLSIKIIRLEYDEVQDDIRRLAIKLKVMVQELKSLIEKFEE